MERELRKRNKHLLPETQDAPDEEDLEEEERENLQNEKLLNRLYAASNDMGGYN